MVDLCASVRVISEWVDYQNWIVTISMSSLNIGYKVKVTGIQFISLKNG